MRLRREEWLLWSLRGVVWRGVGFVVVVVAVFVVLVGDAFAGGCSNEVLRGELGFARLPDCRAYELVSPAAKNGWPLGVLSADGSRVILESLGGFVGSDQAVPVSAYEAERMSGGWSTSPFIEPEGLVSTAELRGNLVAASSDLGRGLFEYKSALSSVHGEHNFYVWDLPEGAPVEVGPALPRAALESNTAEGNEMFEQGVSGDLGRVLFAIRGPTPINPGVHALWPGDSTVGNDGPLYGKGGFGSLYEYSGVGGSEPELVGVRNQRSLVEEAGLKGKAHINEAAELIGQCGTSLGFPRQGSFGNAGLASDEVYNAVSGLSGVSRVFFTVAGASQGPLGDACTGGNAGSGPVVSELFARVVLASGERRTVAISEPSSEDCSACDISKPAEAVFQGASEDGSKVFFLSEQHLLKGAKGENLYEYDFGGEAGRRVVLVAPDMQEVGSSPGVGLPSVLQGVARVSEDGSRVYFVARDKLTSALNPVGREAQEGEDNLYVYDTVAKRTAFIGVLSAKDGRVWQQEDSRPVDATPDGRFLVFTSSALLTPDDTSGVPQVFEYDAVAGMLVRVSVGQGGYNNDGNTTVFSPSITHPFYNENDNPAPQLSSVSDDGSVVFQSSDALTSGAVVGFPNVYEYRGGVVSLISDGLDRTVGLEGIPSTSLVGMDGSGEDIFFTTADRLVAQDGDTDVDVYDARVGGGFPLPVAPVGCEGDGCQGALASAPLFSTLSSPGQPAGENVVEPAVGPSVKAKVKKRVVRHVRRVRRKAKRARVVKAGRAGGSRRGAQRVVVRGGGR